MRDDAGPRAAVAPRLQPLGLPDVHRKPQGASPRGDAPANASAQAAHAACGGPPCSEHRHLAWHRKSNPVTGAQPCRHRQEKRHQSGRNLSARESRGRESHDIDPHSPCRRVGQAARHRCRGPLTPFRRRRRDPPGSRPGACRGGSPPDFLGQATTFSLTAPGGGPLWMLKRIRKCVDLAF